MKHQRTITILIILLANFAVFASFTGITSDRGPGKSKYLSIRGEEVTIYGKGVYRHMSADVAIQGIAQDYVTLFVAVPLLLLSLVFARKGSLRWRFILAGSLNYLFVTYLFYMCMAMYNALFLVYVICLSLSFFALLLTLFALHSEGLPDRFSNHSPIRFTGIFLVAMPVAIALLWLSIVIPPLLDGTLIPKATEHYTTLIVQGFDLSILLPVSIVSGLLLLRKKPMGYLAGTVTISFLPFLMLALVAKIIAMAINGVNVIPAVFIIPVFFLLALTGAIGMIRNIKYGHV
jgi:hypothetical protein